MIYVDTDQAKFFALAGLSNLQIQCVVRGLDCRGAWGELIQKVEAAEATKAYLGELKQAGKRRDMKIVGRRKD